MESLKTWIIEVAVKKIVPNVASAALAALVGYLLAHAGQLSAMGIDYDAVDNTIDISLNKFKEWMIITGPVVVTGIWTLVRHHTGAAIVREPQAGEKS